ncbi:hypothetical protein AJ79_06110, partial [Helicocarpus griseus UAMH5409]
MFGGVLETEFDAEQLDYPPQLRRGARLIVDETTVNSVLLKWNHVIVNRALDLFSNVLGDNGMAMAWALGAHARATDRAIFPDWAGIDSNSVFPAENRVPGDTKVSGKWRTISENEGTPLVQSRERRGGPPMTPVRQRDQSPRSSPTYPSPPQVVIYTSRETQQSSPRYLAPPPRVSQRRPPSVSSTTIVHTANPIDSPATNSSPLSVVQPSPSAYSDDGNPDRNEGPIQIASVPWGVAVPLISTC